MFMILLFHIGLYQLFYELIIMREHRNVYLVAALSFYYVVNVMYHSCYLCYFCYDMIAISNKWYNQDTGSCYVTMYMP